MATTDGPAGAIQSELNAMTDAVGFGRLDVEALKKQSVGRP